MNSNRHRDQGSTQASVMKNRTFVQAVALLMVVASTHSTARTLPKSITDRLPGASIAAPSGSALPRGFRGDGFVTLEGEANLARNPNDNTLVIDQKTAKLLLEWASFNIGADASVHFKQDADATAVNLILDQNPSRIFGNLQADGQVYLLNPNGIIFGENSQVNVRGLIAAAARLNGYEDLFELTDDEIANGQQLTEAQKIQFVQQSLLSVIGDNKSLLVVDESDLLNTDDNGNFLADLPRIVVRPGASIKSKDAPIMLAAPEVHNYGSISNENSQVVLAGMANELYLAVSDRDPDLRGYLVEVDKERTEVEYTDANGETQTQTITGKVVNGSGHLDNGESIAGDIYSALGNVTLVAKEIIQAGKIEATTAVDQNGSIRILARDGAEVQTYGETPPQSGAWEALFYNDVGENSVGQSGNELPQVGAVPYGTRNGEVEFTAGSETTISLDRTGLATDSLEQPTSRIIVAGKSIQVQDAVIKAEGGVDGGEIVFYARENARTRNGTLTEVGSEAEIIIGDGAVLDVSGTEDTLLDASRNAVEIFVTSNEVKDVTEQKGGELLRSTISVDVRQGTELLDWESSLESVERSVTERSVNGGKVDLVSTGAIAIGDAAIDVSGGKVTYEEGYIRTSKVVQNGEIIDISEADPRTPISAVIPLNQNRANDGKWGERYSFSPGSILMSNYSYRASYEQGADAGEFNITAPLVTIDPEADFLAGTTVGLHQGTNAPYLGSIKLDLNRLQTSSDNTESVIIADTLVTDLDAIVGDELFISNNIIEASHSALFEIVAAGATTDFDVQSDLALGEFQDLSLRGRDFNLSADIRALGGDVDIQSEGQVQLSGDIDVSGVWINQASDASYSEAVDAGSISITASSGILQTEDSALIANAGALVDVEGDLRVGKAGHISIDLNGEAIGEQSTSLPVVSLLGRFEAIDNSQGGELSLVLPGTVRLASDTSTQLLAEFAEDSSQPVFSIGQDFFSNNKLAKFNIEARAGNLTVESGSEFQFSNHSFQFDSLDVESNSQGLTAIAEVVATPAYLDQGGGLSLIATKFAEDSAVGRVIVEADSTLQAGPGFTLSLEANESIYFAGEFQSIGGQLNASLGQRSDSAGGEKQNDYVTSSNWIVIDNGAQIDLSAGLRPSSGKPEERLGDRVIAAGSVDLAADFGSVLVNEGADIDLSGDLFNGFDLVSGRRQPVQMGAASGRFELSAEHGFWLGTNIDFGQPEQGYRGGELSLSLDGVDRLWKETSLDRTLVVGKTLTLGGNPDWDFGTALGFGENFGRGTSENAATELSFYNDQLSHFGYVNQDTLASGNLRSLVLDTQNVTNVTGSSSNRYQQQSKIELYAEANSSEPVQIRVQETLYLDSPSLNLNGQNLQLQSPYVSLGELSSEGYLQDTLPVTNTAPIIEDPATELVVDATLVDVVGNQAILGASNSFLSGSYGVRFRAPRSEQEMIVPYELSVSQNLTIRSPKTWLESLTDYQVTAEDQLAFESFGENLESTVSAGANLTLIANSIDIDSEINVPFGQLNIVGDSVSIGDQGVISVATDASVPLGRIQANDFLWVWTDKSNFLSTVPRFTEADEVLLSKLISIDANDLRVSSAATVNISGGGQVYGREFVSGLQGSIDVLASADYDDMFAVVPGLASGYSPFDDLEYAGNETIWGTQFHVQGSAQLADGVYTVLPANYALMPGAYLVKSLSQDLLSAGSRSFDLAGAEVVSGYLDVNGSQRIENWTPFRVESNAIISNLAEYRISSADDFYAGAQFEPGVRPEDNGRLALNIQNSLELSGQVISSDQSNVAARLDIFSANQILIGADDSDENLVIDPILFERELFGDLLVGGQRNWLDGGWQVGSSNNGSFVAGVIAPEINIADVTLSGDEMLFVADQIQVTNSHVVAGGVGVVSGNSWQVDEVDSALLISNIPDSQLVNQNSAVLGAVSLDDATMLDASGTIAIKTSLSETELKNDNFGDSVSSVQLVSDRLSFGDAAGGDVNVEAGWLSRVNRIELSAADGISFNDDLSLMLDGLSLETARLEVAANRQIDISAADFYLASTSASTGVDEVDLPELSQTQGSLLINADRLSIVGQSNSSPDDVAGMDLLVGSLTLKAQEYVDLGGQLELTTGDLNIESGQVGALNGDSSVGLLANSMTLTGGDGAASLDEFAKGTRYSFETSGAATLDTNLAVSSGKLAVSANNITLGENAKLDAAAYEVLFPDLENGILVKETGPAGILSLNAEENISIANFGALYFGEETLAANGGVIELNSSNLSIANYNDLNLGGGDIALAIRSQEIDSGLMEAIAAINEAGANGDLSIVTDSNLVINDNLAATDLFLASVYGNMAINSDIVVLGATKNIEIFGEQGVDINESASLTVMDEAVGEDDSVDLVLNAGSGSLNVAADAQFNLAGGLDVIVDQAVSVDVDRRVRLSANDSIAGDIDLYYANYQVIDTGAVSGQELESMVAETVSLLTNAEVEDYFQVAPGLSVNIRPMLDIYSSGALTVGSNGYITDFRPLRNAAGDPGLFSARSDQTLSVIGQLSDGVGKAIYLLDPFAGTESMIAGDIHDPIPATFFPGVQGGSSVLEGSDSSDLTLVAGVAAGSKIQRPEGTELADIVFADNSFVRTGTGHIRLLASNDLLFSDTAYAATLGKSPFVDNLGLPGVSEDIPYYSGSGFGVLPSGSFATLSLWGLDSKFSGYGVGAGDLIIEVGGDVANTGSSRRSTLPEYRHQLVAGDDLVLDYPFGSASYKVDLDGLDAWYIAIDNIQNGVFAVGGGDVQVSAKGDIVNMHFATPSTGIWQPEDPLADTQVVGGGNLMVEASGDIYSSTFQNDGGTLSVLARGSLKELTNSNLGNLFVVSDSLINATAVGDLVIEGVINTFILPQDIARRGLFAQSDDVAPLLYFRSYDSSSANFLSLSGDFRLKDISDSSDASSSTAIQKFYRKANAQNQLSVTSSEVSNGHIYLPSQLAVTALSGDIIFDEADLIALFPSPTASFSLNAYDSIITNRDDGNVNRFYIPDFATADYPNPANPVDRLLADQLRKDRGDFAAGITKVFHSESLVDRSAADDVSLVALTGSIGVNDGFLEFDVPLPVHAMAGQDVINTNFLIQHSQSNDLSQVIAGNDFRYPNVLAANGTLNQSLGWFDVAGPGDLLLVAGNNIELGSSRGIRSLGNSQYNLLSPIGANIHIYAGAPDFAKDLLNLDVSAVIGNPVTTNTEIPLFSNLFDQDSIAAASFIDMFRALANSVVTLGGTEEGQNEVATSIAELVGAATGRSYIDNETVNLGQALQDYNGLEVSLQQRLAVALAKDIMISQPEQLVADGAKLFGLIDIGEGRLSGDDRAETFQQYFAGVGSFVALDYLQRPERIDDFNQSSVAIADGLSADSSQQFLVQLATMPAAEQLLLTQAVFEQLTPSKQLLVAETITNEHLVQSSIEAAAAGSNFASFERGYVAQRNLFGDQLQSAIDGMHIKGSLLTLKTQASEQFDTIVDIADAVQLGTADFLELVNQIDSSLALDVQNIPQSELIAMIDSAAAVDEFRLSDSDESSLADVLQGWQQDSGQSFAFAGTGWSKSLFDMAFTTVQTGTGGGDINLFVPSGEASIGLSQDLVEALFRRTVPNSELGILAFGNGEVNAVVGSNFNVNESRVIPAAGGHINLWSAYSDVDAGKGAKTSVSTPPTAFNVSFDTGGVIVETSPTVSGSGVQTQESRVSTSEALTDTGRYYRVAEGAGPIYLATPLGIVDAGEAGIQSAGDLFLAAAKVQGADNIDVSGVSVGVPTSTSVGADVGGLGSAVDAATESIQSSAEQSAAENANQSAAFVTIELL